MHLEQEGQHPAGDEFRDEPQCGQSAPAVAAIDSWKRNIVDCVQQLAGPEHGGLAGRHARQAQLPDAAARQRGKIVHKHRLHLEQPIQCCQVHMLVRLSDTEELLRQIFRNRIIVGRCFIRHPCPFIGLELGPQQEYTDYNDKGTSGRLVSGQQNATVVCPRSTNTGGATLEGGGHLSP